MANSNETTTKLGVDISQLKKGLQEAGRQIRLANSEFKAASAGMDDWSKSSEGLEAKISQLSSILDAQNKALDILQQQYDATVAAEGATSKAAEELRIKLNNQRAAIGNTEKQLRTYNTKLDDTAAAAQGLAQEQVDTSNSLDKLKDKISDQERKLSDLKDEYTNLVIEQGKESEAAKDVAEKISVLSGNLNENRIKLDDATGAADDLTNSFEETDTASDNASGGFTIMKGALADLAADGIKACIDALKDFVTDSETAYDNFAAQTGTAAEEMGNFESEINDLYKSNYGESLNDIADVMAEIKKQTGEVDASKLSELSENAITLRDTFGYDVTESIRAANMLMQQFGLDGDEAYGLIAEGAQNGLDKNGDLLDTINEYSSYYKSQGYTAEEFYNSLKNGSEAGTFSVDKLGDAMKEFGIRSKDTADSTTEGFSLLGYGVAATTDEISDQKDKVAELEKKLSYAKQEQSGFNDKTSDLKKQKMADTIKSYSDELETAKGQLTAMQKSTEGNVTTADDMREAFAKGGESAREATEEVLKRLLDMDDQVAQNQAGVDLFGTMWEDLGIEGVKALMNVEGELGDTKKTMEDIKKVKYDNVVGQLKTLGRTAQQELLVPLAEKIIPKVTDFVNWCIENFGTLVPILEGIGTAMLTAFVVTKIGAMVQALTTLVGVVKAWKIATDAQAASQGILNAVTAATPWGAIATAIGLAAGGLVYLASSTDDATEETKLFSEEQQAAYDQIDETNQKISEQKDAYDDMVTARSNAVTDTSAEFTYYQQLKDELDGIVDKHGKVKKGYEDRAEFITTTLAEATGTEIELNDGVIESYDKISESIDNMLLKKQAEAQLANYEQSYTEAINNRTSAYNDLVTAQDNAKKVNDDLYVAQALLNVAQSEFDTAFRNFPATSGPYAEALDNAKENVEKLKDEQKDATKAVSDAQTMFTGYQDTIKNYEGVSAAIIEGDTAKIKSSLNNLTTDFVNAENGTKESLENQVKNMKKNYDNLKKAVDEKAPGVTQEMVDTAKEMVDKSVDELDKFESQAETEGTDGGKAVTKGLYSQMMNFVKATREMSKEGQDGLSSSDYNSTGQKKGAEFADGVSSKNETAKKAGEELGESADDGAQSVSGETAGSYFGEGFTNGIGSWVASAATAAASLASSAIAKIKEITDEHSPSKVTQQVGAYFSEGFAIGISEKAKAAVKAAKSLAIDALEPLNNSSIDIDSGIETASRATSAAASGGSNTTNNSSVTNNFYQTNNSPKPLSRLEVYRQSKNLLSAKGV